MLRLFVLLLLLANLGYLAWSQGMLTALGLGPTRQSEPERLKDQTSALLVRVLRADESNRLEATLAAQLARKECLQAGPLEPVEAAVLEKRLRGRLTQNSWTIEEQLEPARWIVLMGPYPNLEVAAKKQTELKALGVKTETLVNPAMQPGFSLGAFATKDEADARMRALLTRGVRTAKVAKEVAESSTRTLRVPAANEETRRILEETGLMPTGARALRAC